MAFGLKNIASPLLCVASPMVAAHEHVVVLRSAKIVGYTERPTFASGYMHVLQGVIVETSPGRQLILYTTYEGEGQFFPAIGTRCSITYENRAVRGVLAHGGEQLLSPYLRRFDCPHVASDA